MCFTVRDKVVEFNLHVNEISFSYQRMSTKTRFEEEARGNSEMAYCKQGFIGDTRVHSFVVELIFPGQ